MTSIAKRLILAVAVLSMLLGCGASRPTSTSNTGGLHVGISYGNTLLSMADDRLAEALDDAVDIGASWIRMDLSWADAQPTSPQAFAWDRLDHVFLEAHRRGLNVLPILAYTPGWARVPDCFTTSCAPADPSQFATFAAEAAARYAPRGVHTWEIWNEENSARFWQPKPDPMSYTRLLQASSQAIRKADPKAFVVMGGLATLRTTDGNLSVADFLTQRPDSPLHLVDALAVHPYTFPYPASRLGPWASPWVAGRFRITVPSASVGGIGYSQSTDMDYRVRGAHGRPGTCVGRIPRLTLRGP